MSKPESIIEAQQKHMLELIDKFQQEQTASILREANQQAHAEIKQAYRDAKNQLHQSILQDRLRVKEAISSAQAQRDTHIRQQQQDNDQQSLSKAWKMLEQQLMQTWQHNSSQQKWLSLLLHQAANVLSQGNWTIYHAPSWTDKDNHFAKQVEQHTGYKPEFKADENIQSGLRICLESACVDATLHGLLHDRNRIESMLLAAIYKLRNGESL